MAKRVQLTDVEVAELCSQANSEGWQDGLYRVADHLFIQVRGNSRTWQVRWYNGPRVTTMGAGVATKVTRARVGAGQATPASRPPLQVSRAWAARIS